MSCTKENFPALILQAQRPRAPRYFQIVFLALFDLLIKQNYRIRSYSDICNKLNGMGNSTINISGGGGSWSSREKTDLVAATIGVLKPYFTPRTAQDPFLYSYATELENLLTQSYTENCQYDFKQGFYNISTGDIEPSFFEKLFMTLSCMGNTEKGAVGYVIIGVADKKSDAEKIKTRYGKEYIRKGHWYITGLEGEVESFCDGDFDKHLAKLKNAIQQAPFSDYYKRQVGTKVRSVRYHDKSIIVLRIESDNGPVIFANNYYTRMVASNEPRPIQVADLQTFFEKFKTK